jgi:hypothetical protein
MEVNSAFLQLRRRIFFHRIAFQDFRLQAERCALMCGLHDRRPGSAPVSHLTNRNGLMAFESNKSWLQTMGGH